MFNKTYQSRMARHAGGGRKLAAAALARLPEAWRPLVTIAAIAQETFYRPQRTLRREKKRDRHPERSSQLELFAEKPVRDPRRPLFDLFPGAYE
jgi:hypothetical protein